MRAKTLTQPAQLKSKFLFFLDVLAEIEYEKGNHEKALDLIHEARKFSEREYFKKKYEAWIMKIREKQK